MSFLEYYKDFYKILIDYEYLPNKFNDAALLLLIWIDSSLYCGESSICYRIWLHKSKHFLGLPIYKYKYDRYSAADKLLWAYFRAVSRRGIAFSAGNGKDYTKRAKEFAYFSFNYSFYYSSLLY